MTLNDWRKTSTSLKKRANFIFSNKQIFFIEMAHDYRSNNIISIPITAVKPIILSPSPRENGNMPICRPHSFGITVVTTGNPRKLLPCHPLLQIYSV